ncbi:LysR family transcriptional regulator [Hydrogenophaga sp.]|uniref:LysR family transcriptional regulator n=1 Tax=Hydrogenophaga sp. TaxID=1904254 RepID=UPI00271F7C3D|nr:LysR family transcriptional regulator [Hydrogenophaga sp.]MDO9435857.1 LysR family transcriptional regulator [Hydrogenophaga sp.]
MELRQIRYFAAVVKAGSISRAAQELGVVTSALSQQLTRLEGELSTRLLHRSASGVRPTDAGMAFYQQAQLVLRHCDEAVMAAQQARLAGHVSVGLPASTSSILARPFIVAMRSRYPGIRVHLLESLSDTLSTMLDARQLDIAALFGTSTMPRWESTPLVEERLFLIGRPDTPELQDIEGPTVDVERLTQVPLVVGSVGLRSFVDAAFARARCEPMIVLEVDGLAVAMDLMLAGIAATIQTGAALSRAPKGSVIHFELSDPQARRRTVLASLKDQEMSPAALAARVVLHDVARALIESQQWPGADLREGFHDK